MNKKAWKMTNPIAEMIQTQTLSVTQLTTFLKDLIEGSFPFVTIEGEISNFRPSSTGHLYFTLKDANAAISAVMFKGKTSRIKFLPHDGLMVKVTGSLSVYSARGSYQIIIDTMEEAGSGDILKLLEERKQRFAAEGLFDEDRKKTLPFFPQKIGVVTSPTGAALRDILQITQRRNPSISVIVFPCPVQGAEAAPLIAQNIKIANIHKMVDVLIIGRGGGSLEDLLPFSEECVVRAVADSEIPIVSAVGHEIDWALSDFASDVRAPTPSAAAELVTPILSDLVNRIDNYINLFEHEIFNKLNRMKLLVKMFSPDSLELRFRSIEQPLLQRFDDAKEELLSALQERTKQARQRIDISLQKLEGGNPTAILARGYSMVRDAETGKIIRSPADTSIGKNIEIIPSAGKITAEVKELQS